MGITRRQFTALKQRLAGSPRPGLERMASSALAHQVVLGIDPSLRGTGFGIIRLGRPYPQTLAQGTIHCPAGWPRSRCLVRIAEALREVLREHRPTVCAIEALFYAQNLQTALLLGEARGTCLLMAAEAGLEIYEIAPRKVKLAIVGYGAAQKAAVGKMVQRLLRLATPPTPDAADALALALTYLQEARPYNLTPLRPI